MRSEGVKKNEYVALYWFEKRTRLSISNLTVSTQAGNLQDKEQRAAAYSRIERLERHAWFSSSL